MATEDELRSYLKRVTVDLADTRRRLTELTDGADEPIAVVGMSCRFPAGADTVDGYWDLLREGRSAISEVPPERWAIDDYYDPDRRAVGAMYTRHGGFLPDVTGWDAGFFGMSPQEALRMDPTQRLLMELIWEGFEDAGTPAPSLAGSRTAVMVGYMDTVQYGRLQTERYGPGVVADPYFGQGVSASVVAGRLAYQYDLRGPAVTLDTACSSSLVGVHLAAQALRRGECDLAVAAGAFLVLLPDTFIQACATSMLCPDGRCKTFDSTADGYVMGEGGGLVVLERLSSALAAGRRIRAVLRGSAINQDGRSNGLTAPSRPAQVDVIRRAHTAAKVRPAEVDYVEAHGSGTALGDAIELSALHDVFGADRDRPLHVGAVKTNLGHTQAAAGVAGLIKTVLSLQHRHLPANLHLTDPADAVPADGTVVPLTEGTALGDGPRLAGVSSFGWSGTNVHLVLATPPAESTVDSAVDSSAVDGPVTLTLSAADDGALADARARLAEWLRANPDADLADVAHTLHTGRAQLPYRHAVLATSVADAAEQLDHATGSEFPVPARARVAYLLPGVGDQYPGLGVRLYRTEPVFAAAVDECLAAARERCEVDLTEAFFAEDSATPGDFAALLGRADSSGDGSAADAALRHTELAHPLLFTVEYALAALLADRGVKPDVLIGYSLGEYVAACLAGVFTLADALHVVVERARLIASAPAGRMVAVAAGEDTVLPHTGPDSGVDIAAVTGPTMTVLSGPAERVDAVTAALRAAGHACQPLRTEHAFHSSLLEPVRDKLAALVASVPRQAPAVTIVSNLTGRPLAEEQVTSPQYWADHLLGTVRFADGVRACVEAGVTAFVELGPGQTLGGLVRQNLTGGTAVLGTLPPRWVAGERPDERTELLGTCARLWEQGVAVRARTTGRLITLPGYPFQRRAYWPEPGAPTPVRPTRPAEPADLCYTPAWRHVPIRLAGGTAAIELPGPLVVFTDVPLYLADEVTSPVVEVLPGTDPRQVFPGLAPDGPVHVAYLWSLDGGLDTGVDALLGVVHAIGELGRDVRLLTATAGAVEVLGDDATAPLQAAAHGLGRVVQHEYPHITWTGVDLDPEAPATAAQLAAELTRPADPRLPLAAWRRGRRWVKDWAELDVTPTGDTAPWRADGVYLVTGGTRGLGMALARHIAGHGVRGLALLGRTPQSELPEQVANDITALRGTGVEVLTLTADAGAPDALRAALATCREHFGALTGVVHAAGVPAGGMLQRRAVEDVRGVLAPKLGPLEPFAELLRSPEPPELLVLYSSAVTAFGGIGEGDYCAANTVLDAWAEANGTPTTQVLSVAWGPWRHDDWQSQSLQGSALAERVRGYRERYGFTDTDGCALLDRLLDSGHSNVLAVRQSMDDALRDWSAMLDLDQLTGATPLPAAERFPRPKLRTEFVAPRSELEETVAEVWQTYLGIDRVGVHDPFFDLGGNSLVGMTMVRAVEQRLDTQIAPAVLFEHPTVAAFAAALQGAASGAPTTPDVLTTSSARGQRRRRARATRGNED